MLNYRYIKSLVIKPDVIANFLVIILQERMILYINSRLYIYPYINYISYLGNLAISCTPSWSETVQHKGQYMVRLGNIKHR